MSVNSTIHATAKVISNVITSAHAVNNVNADADINSNIVREASFSQFNGDILEANTYTPTTENIVIDSNQYLAGPQTILGDANLVGDNIFQGVSIFGVAGTLPLLESLGTLGTWNIPLSDTSFDDWTASTTNTSILATEQLGTFEADLANYVYIIKWKYELDWKYLAGATLKSVPIRQCSESWQTIFRRFNTLAQLEDGTQPYNAVATQMTAPVTTYYNTSGNRAIYVSVSYGINASTTACTFTSTSSDTPTVRYRRPVIYVRCNNTYFATARKAYIDSANMTIKIKAELYRVKASTSLADAYDGVQDIYNNGI